MTDREKLNSDEQERCVCKWCAFADCCPGAYFPIDKQICGDLRDMRKKKERNEND